MKDATALYGINFDRRDGMFEFLAVTALILSIGATVWMSYHFYGDYQNRRSIAAFAAQFPSRSGETVALSKLAHFEQELPPGSTVIVLAHRIEEPQEGLRAAVQDNFQQGIRYIFLVSQSQYNRSVTELSDFFKAIYVIAKRLSPAAGPNAKVLTLTFEELFSILPLSGEWTSWPYVLYMEPSGERQRVWVFRGNLRKEGLAETYVQLGNIEAESFMNAIRLAMKGANHELFAAGAVIDFTSDKIVRMKEAR
ncbi:hypothetical protein ACNJYD_08485 [Bradyrhizobium sp. DASA03005]|uniref:hypothetical protein n=1 Tax=Bradyrhizobium sp. SPXBL-02 TaxID=3395912 RepID=UPI003F6E557C